MPIEEHLRDDEDIGQRYRNQFATDRRVIKYSKGWFSEKTKDLDYDHISSISVSRSSSLWILLLGPGIVALGLKIAEHGLTGFGILLFLFGLLYREGSYVLTGVGGESMVVGEHKYLKGLWEKQKKSAEDFIENLRTVKSREVSSEETLEEEEESESEEDIDNEDNQDEGPEIDIEED